MPTDAAPIQVRYEVGGTALDKQCDLLVLACDPRGLKSVCDYDPDELALFEALRNFTFHTEVLKVSVNSPQTCAALFAPTPLEAQVGRFHGFRNESAKQYGLEAASALEYNFVTTYQILGPGRSAWSDEKFREVLRQDIQDCSWWPFDREFEVVQTLTTPYFDHFFSTSLQDHLPWKWLDRQGKHGTLFVHASTCFESILHCWGYADLALSQLSKGGQEPPPTDAAILIVGAGPSGLLTAVQLLRRGYTNVEILESTNRFGGKTRTIQCPGGPAGVTICELGTCYASPAYQPMFDDLEAFLTGNELKNFAGKTPEFRSMVTTGQFPPTDPIPEVVGFGQYVIAKAELLDKDADLDRITVRLLADLARYGLLHWEIMGGERPMPTQPPSQLAGDFGSQTFQDFLAAYELLSLVGLFQYSQEVQGYGSLSSIPAYYGLLWLTPTVTNAILADYLDTLVGLTPGPVVSTFARGWGNLWDQIVADERITITYSASIQSIVRPSTDQHQG